MMTASDSLGFPQFPGTPGVFNPVPDDLSQLAANNPMAGFAALDGFNLPNMQGATPDMWSMDGFLGNRQTPGWGGAALGIGNALMSTFMGMKQYGLAKKTLAENKRQFNLNFGAQRQTVNTQLEDRQRARVASNPGAYQSVGDYMSTNGIKG